MRHELSCDYIYNEQVNPDIKGLNFLKIPAFDQLARINPMNPANEENAGRAQALCGDVQAGIQHLERALELDPLLLSAAGTLEDLYRQQGDVAKQSALQERMRKAFGESR